MHRAMQTRRFCSSESTRTRPRRIEMLSIGFVPGVIFHVAYRGKAQSHLQKLVFAWNAVVFLFIVACIGQLYRLVSRADFHYLTKHPFFIMNMGMKPLFKCWEAVSTESRYILHYTRFRIKICVSSPNICPHRIQAETISSFPAC